MATVDFKNLEAPSPNVPSTGLRELPSSTLNKTWFSALYKMANSITGALNSFLPQNKTIGFNVTSQEDLTNYFIDNFKGVRQSAISEIVVSEIAFGNQEYDPIVKLRNKTNTGFFETIVSPTAVKINDKISFNSSTRTVKAVNFEGTCTMINVSSTNSESQNLLFSISNNNNSVKGGYGSDCQWDTQLNSLLVNKINVSGVEVNEDGIDGTSARANKITFYTSSDREFYRPLLTKNVAQELNNYYSIIKHQYLNNHGSYDNFSQIESGGGKWLNFEGIMTHADTLKFVEVDQSENEYFALLNEKTAYSQNRVKSTIKINAYEIYADSFIGGTADYCETTEKIYLNTSSLSNTYYPIFGNLNGSFYTKASSNFKATIFSSGNVTLSTKIIGKAETTQKFSSSKTMQFKNNNTAFLSGIGSSKFEANSTGDRNGSINISSSLIRNFSLINFTGYASPTNPINVGHSSFFILMTIHRRDFAYSLDNKLICFYINVNGKSSREFYYRGNNTIGTEYLFRLESNATGKYYVACYRSVTDPDGTVHWALIDKTNNYARNVIVIPFD